jgi:hypothetical protein
VGLETHVINDEIFAIMVLMAVTTTFMTTPLVSYIYPPQYFRKAEAHESGDDAELSTLGLDGKTIHPFRLLVCLPGLRFV